LFSKSTVLAFEKTPILFNEISLLTEIDKKYTPKIDSQDYVLGSMWKTILTGERERLIKSLKLTF